ncbi:MAG: hypothetical protein HYW33_00540 [Candidatus Blackburnbacteria bacterium]|nr:hypothetical protein [Candidatus Blackburnbacteria bacterium]
MKLFKPARNLIRSVARHPKFFVFILFCALVAAPAAYAQYSLDTHQEALNASGQNLQKFSEQNFAGFVNSVNTALLGCPKCNDSDLKVGVMPFTVNMIAGLYSNPPASGIAYLDDVAQRFNPVRPAYAQTGTGFTGLAPLLPLWKAFRDFAYAFFAILFVGIGLAIMFRMKLDPRTVLTIQSAIPRIVIALLLVTFSYAIAGLMIDLLYVMISLAILIFGRAGADVPHFQEMYLTGGFGALWGSLWGVVGGGKTAVVSGLTSIAGLLGFLLLPTIPVLSGALFGIGLGAGLFLLLLVVIIIYVLFKIFMDLLRAYIGIIIAVVLGPLQIALGVIPGFPGFGSWLKGLFTNVLIFVGVAFVLMLGQTIIGLGFATNLWHPPLLVGGGLVGTVIPVLISIGILQIVHQVPEAVRQIMAGRPPEFAPGQAVNTLVGSPASGAMEDRARRSTGFFEAAAWRVGGGILGSGGGRRR